MRSQLFTPSVALAVLVSVQVNAQDVLQRAETRDSWFGSSGGDSSDPYDVPTARPQEPPPPASQATPVPPNGPRDARAKRHDSQTVPVRFEPDDPSVHLLDQDGMMPFESVVPYHWSGWWGWPYPYGYYRAMGAAPIYNPVCQGSCLSRVRRGPHQFALSKQGGPIVPVQAQVAITEASLIQARYVDRGDLRTAGVLIGVVGSLGGLVMMILSVHDEQHCDGYTCTTRSEVDDALAAAGLGVFAGSIIASAVLINQKDQAYLSVGPLRLSAPDPRLDPPGWSRSQPRLQGASLAMHF